MKLICLFLDISLFLAKIDLFDVIFFLFKQYIYIYTHMCVYVLFFGFNILNYIFSLVPEKIF